ncbi:MAG: pantoate--beta-alanine ligase [Acidimicrobiales bacterium]
MTATMGRAPEAGQEAGPAPSREACTIGGQAPGAVRLVESVDECAHLLDAARSKGMSVGLVPTMGALHAGHRSLIERAAAECDLAVTTIFVNPLQFSDPDDIARYPRTLDADLGLAGSAGARVVFAPPVREMYPEFPAPIATSVSVAGLADRWEGASRAGHFDGVATVVSKLFAMTGRSRAYFGEKDFQQLSVLRQMAKDLSFPVEIVGCPTIREENGLALSSRNVRLTPDQRRAASVLSRSLRIGAVLAQRGEDSPRVIESAMDAVVRAEPLVDLDYAVVVRADDLQPATSIRHGSAIRLLIAATVGGVRLIDNLDPNARVDPGSLLPMCSAARMKGTN